MLEKINAFFTSNELFSSLTNNLISIQIYFKSAFENVNSLRVVSIIILVAALILLLFLVIVLYIKSIISFVRKDSSASSSGKTALANAARTKELEKNLELDLEKELEKELERELTNQQNDQMLLEEAQKQVDFLEQQKTNELGKNKKLSEEEKIESEKQNQLLQEALKIDKHKGSEKNTKVKEKVELDWKKGQKNEEDPNIATLSGLSYQQAKQPLTELVGLMVDMLGRGIDEFKIAQTMSHKTQGLNSEDEILQTIDAIKSFASLCANGSFKDFLNSDNVTEHSAIHLMTQGDMSQALLLMESLMDKKIEAGSAMPKGKKRDEIFKETSNLANLFGTIATLNDDQLALGAFELSIELEPENINSWSKIGNVYSKLNANNKAVWAFQNVLNSNDEENYPAEFANANIMLSKHLYAQGENLQATALYNQSKSFYDMIGINRNLDKKEVEIITLIENNQNENVNNSIERLMALNSNQRTA